MTRHLLVGSIQPHSGKSTILLALSRQLHQRGQRPGYYKPLGFPICDAEGVCVDEDVRYLSQELQLQVPPPLVLLEPQALEQALLNPGALTYENRLLQQLRYVKQANGDPVDWIWVEAGGSPTEGALFKLSLPQLAHKLEAQVMIVVRYSSLVNIEPLLGLLPQLPHPQMGVILNDVPPEQCEHVRADLVPRLEAHGLHVLGVLPSHTILHSISVGELALKLGAEILSGREHLDLLIEQVNIGAMSVSAALRFFRRMTHKAVVTGGDRTDIQMAALQTSTNCLILTGQLPPDPKILARAEELEVPVLSVVHDTLKTVRLIETAINQARFQEPVKVECIQNLLTQHLDLDAFCEFYGFATLDEPLSA